jgi:NAD+ diphosphatase
VPASDSRSALAAPVLAAAASPCCSGWTARPACSPPGEPSRCLLARHRGAARHAYATLAGFVELGESLEDAVRREIAEETGVQVGEVIYQASQPRPFPAGLMIDFRARAVSEAIRVDNTELEEARWFTRADLSGMLAPGRPAPGDSIESYLIGSWLRESA